MLKSRNASENPAGIETFLALPGMCTAMLVATHQKTQQGLKPQLAFQVAAVLVATHQKTQQGLKH